MKTVKPLLIRKGAPSLLMVNHWTITLSSTAQLLNQRRYLTSLYSVQSVVYVIYRIVENGRIVVEIVAIML